MMKLQKNLLKHNSHTTQNIFFFCYINKQLNKQTKEEQKTKKYH